MLRILVAEDTLVNQLVADKMLQRIGHSVDCVDTGAEALARCQEKEYDLILMDLQMPEMDGFEATRRIREMEKKTGRHVIIVALTAHALEGDRAQCLGAGMDNYLSKPLHSRDLYALLEKLFPASCVGAS
jgi:CheY-like chemotaxis protein